MILNTKHFGDIEIDQNGIIIFEEGLPGFEQAKRFVLLYDGQPDSPFCWLQSVDQPDLAFAMINPEVIMPDYTVEIDDDIVERLGIESPSDVIYYAIVVIPDDIAEMTANMKAPVIINVREKKGMQVVMDNSDYDIRYNVFSDKRKALKL
ncbi:MAG: flagellar assembly factor FliW [Clostridiales bacterium]|nr:flagellar assembly factor FliW [Clostridiales bacterium]